MLSPQPSRRPPTAKLQEHCPDTSRTARRHPGARLAHVCPFDGGGDDGAGSGQEFGTDVRRNVGGKGIPQETVRRATCGCHVGAVGAVYAG